MPNLFQIPATYQIGLRVAGGLCHLLSGGRRQFARAVLRPVMLMLMLTLSPASLQAAQPEPQKQLVFITSDHCPFCQAWERQVGRLYDKTPYAAEARLIRVDIDAVEEQLPDLTSKPRGTPTFLVFADGREIGRFEGFTDADTFYWVLSEFVTIP